MALEPVIGDINNLEQRLEQAETELNNIDGDDDGVVDKANTAISFEVRSSDPANPSPGQVWIID